MRLIPRRNKRGPAKAADTLVSALKLGAIVGGVQGATKGAGKAVKATAAYKAGKTAAKRTPVLRKAPIVLAAGGAAVVAARKLRSGNGSVPVTTHQSSQPPAAVPG